MNHLFFSFLFLEEKHESLGTNITTWTNGQNNLLIYFYSSSSFSFFNLNFMKLYSSFSLFIYVWVMFRPGHNETSHSGTIRQKVENNISIWTTTKCKNYNFCTISIFFSIMIVLSMKSGRERDSQNLDRGTIKEID